MKTRRMHKADLPKLKALYDAQGWKYDWPDFAESQFVVKQVVVDEQDNLVAAVCARKTVEVFMLADHEWRTPKWRLEAVKLIQESVRKFLHRQGYHDSHAWLPPEIEKSFGRRLQRTLGWNKQMWTCFSRSTE